MTMRLRVRYFVRLSDTRTRTLRKNKWLLLIELFVFLWGFSFWFEFGQKETICWSYATDSFRV